MDIGQNVKIKNHPDHSGQYGVVTLRYRKGTLTKYTVSIDSDTKTTCFPYQLTMVASDNIKLATWEDIETEVDWKPENTIVKAIGE